MVSLANAKANNDALYLLNTPRYETKTLNAEEREAAIKGMISILLL